MQSAMFNFAHFFKVFFFSHIVQSTRKNTHGLRIFLNKKFASFLSSTEAMAQAEEDEGDGMTRKKVMKMAHKDGKTKGYEAEYHGGGGGGGGWAEGGGEGGAEDGGEGGYL